MLGLGFMLSVSCHMLSLFTTLLLPPRPPKMPDDAHYPHQSQTSPAFKDAAARGPVGDDIAALFQPMPLHYTNQPTKPEVHRYSRLYYSSSSDRHTTSLLAPELPWGDVPGGPPVRSAPPCPWGYVPGCPRMRPTLSNASHSSNEVDT